MTPTESAPRPIAPELARREGETGKDYLFRLTDNPGKELLLDAGELSIWICRGSIVDIIGDQTLWISIDEKAKTAPSQRINPSQSSEAFGYIADDRAVCSYYLPYLFRSKLDFEYHAYLQAGRSPFVPYEMTYAEIVTEALEGYAGKIDIIIRKLAEVPPIIEIPEY